jgi:hypothetical protein
MMADDPFDLIDCSSALLVIQEPPSLILSRDHSSNKVKYINYSEARDD